MGCKVKFGSDLMFPKDYLCVDDLKGRDVTLTMSKVLRETLHTNDGGAEEKYVITFERTQKKLVCNVTNATSIGNIHGLQAEKDWPGKPITLYPTRCMSFGKMTPCIRIREKLAPGAKGVTAPEPTQDASTAPAEFENEMIGGTV